MGGTYATFSGREILQDTDARVRANLIESLWNIDSRSARDIFRAAMWDTHHRVRTNALLGLYFMGESSAAYTLIEASLEFLAAKKAGSPPEQRMAAGPRRPMRQTTNERFRPTRWAPEKILSTDQGERERERGGGRGRDGGGGGGGGGNDRRRQRRRHSVEVAVGDRALLPYPRLSKTTGRFPSTPPFSFFCCPSSQFKETS